MTPSPKFSNPDVANFSTKELRSLQRQVENELQRRAQRTDDDSAPPRRCHSGRKGMRHERRQHGSPPDHMPPSSHRHSRHFHHLNYPPHAPYGHDFYQSSPLHHYSYGQDHFSFPPSPHPSHHYGFRPPRPPHHHGFHPPYSPYHYGFHAPPPPHFGPSPYNPADCLRRHGRRRSVNVIYSDGNESFSDLSDSDGTPENDAVENSGGEKK
ncbi:hypothetical protein BABINDRAFT_13117 [Babjeviella inositovora NRRL Y-12698]|uniref:Uncharacterized protein n=1 Tax=Babjeviella inositovora NRRL Y-12698 TaxID=984486 RepID=A0A1E3QRH4_9ASCO|nr:uncharacterized protein BABINDRAFT_13117 [Babjeviella inositovora NRRL Y-12698]ODQ80238.1 hypothetical protein BABINDRAFT_13117 [Babjeviella inositovora NRRL Y-12698]